MKKQFFVLALVLWPLSGFIGIISHVSPCRGDDESVAEIIKNVRQDFELSSMTFDIPEEIVRRQSELVPSSGENDISFSEAINLALISFHYDDSDIESPLSLVKNEWPEGPNPVKRLHDFLNRPSTKLRILREDERAEHGETVWENWIFFLSIPEFSDHLYWAIIHRQGVKAPYNYGFN